MKDESRHCALEACTVVYGKHCRELVNVVDVFEHDQDLGLTVIVSRSLIPQSQQVGSSETTGSKKTNSSTQSFSLGGKGSQTSGVEATANYKSERKKQDERSESAKVDSKTAYKENY